MFILPNLLTVSSIFCGFYAVVASSQTGDARHNALIGACAAIFFAMVCDSMDGRVARLTRTQSEFGVQMDSLADVISFGVAPAVIAWHFGLSAFGTWGLFACAFYAICGAIRLARFNVMAAVSHGPSPFFVGLPIPGGAGLLTALILAALQKPEEFHLTAQMWWAPIVVCAVGLLMVSTLPFRTFKATRAKVMLLIALGTLAVGCVIAYLVYPSFALVVLMFAYLGLGLFEGAWRLVHRKRVAGGAEGGSDVTEAAADEEDVFAEEVNQPLDTNGPLELDAEEDLLD